MRFVSQVVKDATAPLMIDNEKKDLIIESKNQRISEKDNEIVLLEKEKKTANGFAIFFGGVALAELIFIIVDIFVKII